MHILLQDNILFVVASSSDRGVLARAPLNGSQWEMMINDSSLAGVSGVAVDPWTNNIYW